MDAPHTGARLETRILQRPRNKLCDAPHTGARLETVLGRRQEPDWRMPPTRGHDLKRSYPGLCSKHPPGDAPHTGARLETAGARTNAGTWRRCPHTGKRFKIFRAPSGKYARGCPYRFAAFCFTVFALFLNAFLLQTASGVKAHAFVNADHSLDFLPPIQWLLLTY